MTKIFFVCSCFFLVGLSAAYGHQNKMSDGNLQADLMPQELNPAFYEKDASWRSVMPQTRARRSGPSAPADLVESAIYPVPTTSVIEQVKQYSRIVACVVLVVSAAIEIVVYFIEMYQVERVAPL